MTPQFKAKLLQSFKIWIAIYPAITLLLLFFGKYLAQVPLFLRTLILTLILVPSMVFVLLPLVNRLFATFDKGKNKVASQ